MYGPPAPLVPARRDDHFPPRCGGAGSPLVVPSLATGTGHWCRIGEGSVAVHRVEVHNRTDTPRDESFTTRDLPLPAKRLAEAECSPQYRLTETTI